MISIPYSSLSGCFVALVLAMLMGPGCSSRTTEPETGEGLPQGRSALDRTVGLQGKGKLLARSQGKTGTIEVRELRGRRLLLINGVVHASMPLGRKGPTPDPMIQLIRGAAPKGQTALVVGLGSGNTATALSRAGFHVEAVDIEPQVIAYARQFFGYKGHSVSADGLDYLKNTWRVYDVILLDAFVGKQTPKHLVSQEAIRLIRHRLYFGGLVAVRMLDSPKGPAVKAVMHNLASSPPDNEEKREWEKNCDWHTAMFGSGVGDEVQNLYILAKAGGVAVQLKHGIPVWPVMGCYAADACYGPDRPIGTTVRGVRRTVTGYLVRLGKKPHICLDLPHYEMGAYRFVLTGPKVKVLAGRLSKVEEFPSQGALFTDGDVSQTLKTLIPARGSPGYEVRFSPVAASVQGSVKLRTRAPLGSGYERTDPLLPIGGTLYEIEVEKILWVLDFAKWKIVETTLKPILQAAAKAIQKGKLTAGAQQLDLYLGVLRSVLGTRPEGLRLYSAVDRFRKQLFRKGQKLGSHPSRKSMAKRCREIRYVGGPQVLSEALESCQELSK